MENTIVIAVSIVVQTVVLTGVMYLVRQPIGKGLGKVSCDMQRTSGPKRERERERKGGKGREGGRGSRGQEVPRGHQLAVVLGRSVDGAGVNGPVESDDDKGVSVPAESTDRLRLWAVELAGRPLRAEDGRQQATEPKEFGVLVLRAAVAVVEREDVYCAVLLLVARDY